jgi:hypothetical protein
LSVLWALQWGITGAVLTYLPIYFRENGLSEKQVGQILATSAFGLWIAPFIVGQVCDRWMNSERYLAIAHFFGGLTLACIPIATEVYNETRGNFTAILVLNAVYSMLYFPTVPLASSLTFRHLSNPDVQFGSVRVWGTVGWVLAGLSLSLWLEQAEVYRWLATSYPNWRGTLGQIGYTFSWMAPPSSSDAFKIAALLSFALSSFCVFLPPTPPARTARGAFAPLQTLAMFRDRNFSILIGTSFLLAVAVTFYTFAVPELLRQFGFARDAVPAVMTIGQISEFPALLLLPLFLRFLGLKITFALGMAAWLVRYMIFAANGPTWLVLTGIALHGICHVFLIVVIQLYVDTKCRPDLRASAQNLFAFITMGIALPVGFLASGELARWCNLGDPAQADYATFFAIPSALIAILLLAYWKWFSLPAPAPDPARAIDAPEFAPEAAARSST